MTNSCSSFGRDGRSPRAMAPWSWPRKTPGRHQRLRLGEIEHEREFALAEDRHQRVGAHADAQAGDVQGVELPPVGKLEGEHIALSEPMRMEAERHPVREPLQLAPGEGRLAAVLHPAGRPRRQRPACARPPRRNSRAGCGRAQWPSRAVLLAPPGRQDRVEDHRQSPDSRNRLVSHPRILPRMPGRLLDPPARRG